MDFLKGKRILVIDDVEAERMLISTYLHQIGCRVYHANDGIDGIHKAKLIIPDLILMDLDMPCCDGYASCKVLSIDPSTGHIPIIFISAFSTPDKRVKGLLSGAVDYIGKPFDFDEVKLRISIHLRSNIFNKDHNENLISEAFKPVEEANDKEANLYSILFHSARVHLLSSLGDAPTMRELERLTRSNRRRLNAAFRYCAGMTMFEYLREARMKEAHQLLKNTALSIGDIACCVGFSSSANFTTAFKDRFGITPSAFRRTSAMP